MLKLASWKAASNGQILLNHVHLEVNVDDNFIAGRGGMTLRRILEQI